jgi:tetratricopeptide (TPR) repeat protein
LLRKLLIVGLLVFNGTGSWTLAQNVPSPNVPGQGTGGGSTEGKASLARAQQLYRAGKFNDAIAEYQNLLKDNPGSPEAYAGLSRVYRKQQKIDEALVAASKAVQLGPASAEAHVSLGEVYFRQARMADAQKEFVGVIQSGNANARAFLGLASINHSISLYRRYKAMIDEAHRLDPSDPEIQREWLITLRRPDRIKTLEVYLAGENNEDAEERAAAARYLELQKALEKEPDRRCQLAVKASSTETDLVSLVFDAKHPRGYGLKVAINGKNSTLMLDTGASGILIDRKLAEKAGIEPLARAQLQGIGDKGTKSAYRGYADSVKVGNLEFRNCLVEVIESRTGLDEDGLIGADVFSSFLVDLDFPNAKLRLSELPKIPNGPAETASLQIGGRADSDFQDSYIAPEMKSYVRVYRFGHDLLIPTMVGEVPQKLFLIDTGANTNMISSAAAREVTKVRDDPYTKLKGLSGSVKNVFEANKVVLQFANFRQENQHLLAFDLSSVSRSAGTEVSGILGFVVLRTMEMKIDYRDGLVGFTYDPKRWQ